jgi:hypothetical protein
MDVTVADLFTAAGAGAAALVVRQIVELLKAALPPLDAAVSGALQAFVLTAAVYVVAVLGTPVQQTPDGILAAIVAWVTCATAAIGIDQAWSRVRS